MNRILMFMTICMYGQSLLAQTGILSSQIGYESGRGKRILVCDERQDFIPADAGFIINDLNGNKVFSGRVESWGYKWGRQWWIADFSGFNQKGKYKISINHINLLVSDTIEIGDDILWQKCFHTMAFDNLNKRAELARSGKGWKDCGSDLQEFSSHVVAIDALCDVLEIGRDILTASEKDSLIKQIITGSAYLVHLQDKAKTLGLGDGSVIHEDRQTDVVTGNVAKAAMIFARISRLIRNEKRELADVLLNRSVKAFTWIEENGPVVNPEEQVFFPHVHGAPLGSLPPKDQWMTRDLVMMCRASVELFKAGEKVYRGKAVYYAGKVMKRQVPPEENEKGLYGHFYTYEDYTPFGGVKFTEKADIHCGAWSKEGRIYNKGGHYPHYLIPMIEMVRLWPHHKEAGEWRQCLHNFAYGYFLPACSQSPFLILPAGYYRDQGLLYFGSWYHGHNKIYPLAASLALEFSRFFNDDRFIPFAVANLQWIAGLNAGVKDELANRYLSVSMISGIGSRFHGGWSNIPGSICNGFSAGKQFNISPASAEKDMPSYFNDEDYIAHTLPYLAALIRMKAY